MSTHSPPPSELSINLDVPLARVQIRLQHAYDRARFGLLSTKAMTPEGFAKRPFFFNFDIASDKTLAFGEAQAQAEQWCLRNTLVESITAVGAYLDECFWLCRLAEETHAGEILLSKSALAIESDCKKFRRMNFPTKLETLEARFAIASPFKGQFLSLNRVRNCLIHRDGWVGQDDADQEGKLVLRQRHCDCVATRKDNGAEFVIGEAGYVTEAETTVSIRVRDHERSFSIGDQIQLSPQEHVDSVLTLWLFLSELDKAFKLYFAARGLSSTTPPETPTGVQGKDLQA